MPNQKSDWQKLWDELFGGGILEWLSFIATILVIAAIIWSIVRVRAWFRDDVGADESDEQLLIQMMEMRREGELSEEEYRSIKHRLAARLRSTSPAALQDQPTSTSSSG